MKVTENPLLRIQDFPDQQSWIGRLFSQINPFFQSIYTAVNGGVNFKDNINCVDSDQNITSFTQFSIQWPFSGTTPSNLQVLTAYNSATSEPTILLAAWSYDSSKNSVTITKMLEVTSSGNVALSGKYTFTIRVSV